MSRTRLTRCTLAAALLTAAAAGAAPATAQIRLRTTFVVESAEQADALHVRAERLFETPARYREAARLLRRAATLRSADDPTGTEEFLLAGRLSYYARDVGEARRSFQAAAERALTAGEVGKSAHAYIDAAFAALSQKRWQSAQGYVESAERLAGSSYMQAAERERILTRVRPVRLGLAASGEVNRSPAQDR